MPKTELLEPSLLDVIAAIEAANDLAKSKKTFWCCSLRQICSYLNRPLATVAARSSGLNTPLRLLHAARVGANPKTLSNHKANTRAALLWFQGANNIPARGIVLSPAWAALRKRIPDTNRQSRISGLIRYASARKIEPTELTEELLDDYMRYRAETTALAANDAARRTIARAWNACSEDVEGWPQQALIEPIRKAQTMLPWEAFDPGLRNGIESYLATLTRMRRGEKGRRIRPCRPSTIETRRRELQSFCRAAIEVGTPISSLTSLADLLNPDLVEKIINTYWEKNGPEPKIYTIDLGWKLLSIARETKCRDNDDLKRLDDIRAAVEEHRCRGLTPKNLEVIRSVLTDGVWSRVVQLPEVLMAEARSYRHQSPTRAAVTAQVAVAIAILASAPIRVGNLAAVELEKNLIKPGGLEEPYWLVFPHYDVKNRVQLEFKLDRQLSDLIDEYVHDHRPRLLRGSNGRYLFPGKTRANKIAKALSVQITKRIFKATGLRITAHQFRHAAAAILLKHRPGEYELARRLLGHRNIETTRNFYIGLENIQASEIFGEIIRNRMTGSLEAAE